MATLRVNTGPPLISRELEGVCQRIIFDRNEPLCDRKMFFEILLDLFFLFIFTEFLDVS